MKNKQGFTLTEILLAVMIVGIIGVALASLTTAATRETGVARSRVVLRDNLSLAFRQLRRDVQSSTQVWYVKGKINSVSGTTAIPLLALQTNAKFDGTALVSGQSTTYITYCFVPGTKTKLDDGTTNVLPSGAKDGGAIWRRESTTPSWSNSTNRIPKCNVTGDSNFKVFLQNVKFIPPSAGYPAPFFRVAAWSGNSAFEGTYQSTETTLFTQNMGSQLMANLVLEVPSSPVVNDATEQIFFLPNQLEYRWKN